MKKIVVNIVKFIGFVFSYLYSYRLYKCLCNVYYVFYTGWIKREFKHFGNNSKVMGGVRLYGQNMIEVGDDMIVDKTVEITAHAFDGDCSKTKIIFGNNCKLNSGCRVTAVNYIQFGNSVRAGKNVLVTDNTHGDPKNSEHNKMPLYLRPIYSKGPVIIGDNVWIGEKASIMPNVTIGNDVIIGANTVVTKDVPTGAIAVGSPMRIITRKG